MNLYPLGHKDASKAPILELVGGDRTPDGPELRAQTGDTRWARTRKVRITLDSTPPTGRPAISEN